MKIYEIFFSPTKGTETVCEIISAQLKGRHVKVDLMSRTQQSPSIGRDDFCVIAMPCYGGRAPETAVKRLAQMDGGGAKTLLVAVYGNREFDDTLVEMADEAAAHGFVPVAAVAAVAQHSIMGQFGAGRPDQRDREELESYGGMIALKLEKGDDFAPPRLPGNRPYCTYKGLPLHPRATGRCNGCGLCAKTCPTGAIDSHNLRRTDNARCITCMACVAACPQGARRLNPLILKAASMAMKKACGGRKPNRLFMETDI